MSTNCVFPPELDEKQLLEYLDDPDGDPETARHLAGCPYCKGRAASLERLQRRLTIRLYRASCPTPLELGEFHMRVTPAAQRLLIARHVSECPHCEREISELEEFLEEPAPPTSVLETVKVMIARLVSGGAQMGTALRGEANTSPVFDADGRAISMTVQPGLHGETSILGQIAADDQDRWTGAAVELKQPYLAALHGTIDDLGAFTFDTVDPGPMQIRITSSDGVVIQTENTSIPT